MDLARAKLLRGKGMSYADELNVNLTQIPIRTKTSVVKKWTRTRTLYMRKKRTS